MTVSLVIARLLLSAVFCVAGMAKLFRVSALQKTVTDFGIPDALGSPLARLLPPMELLLAAALLPVATAWWAAVGTIAMLSLFIGAIGINLARGRRPDCQCFGQLHSTPIGWKTIARNLVLALLAGWIILQGPDNILAVSLIWDGRGQSQSAFLGMTVAIGLLGIFQTWSLIHVLRQNGRLLLRIETLEARAGAPAESVPAGLPLDTPAPAFSLDGLDSERVTFESLRSLGKPVLLFFSEPGCGACDAALPGLAEWQRELSETLSIVPISTGPMESNRAKAKKYNVRNLLIQKARETAEAYGIDRSPGAVLIVNGLIASPAAFGIDAIRALVARATLPPSVKKGDPAPSFRLPDLKGAPVNFGHLRGRRTLLLFWNPSCGFCQQMLKDVKAWERSRTATAPDLLVVSAGEVAAIRDQGFRARVILDPYFAASQVFNAGGTPAAVILDENGIVASDVAVGAPEVLELAGVAAHAER